MSAGVPGTTGVSGEGGQGKGLEVDTDVASGMLCPSG